MRIENPWRQKAGSRLRAVAALLVVLAAVTGCTTANVGNNNVIRTVDVLESVRGQDLSPRSPRNPNEAARKLSGNRAQGSSGAIVYDGSGGNGLSGSRPLFAASNSGSAYDVNLENSDIKTAAKVIFGDILGKSYLVDPRVQGTVSLSTGRPVKKNHLLVYFENALRFSNAAILKDSLGYRIVPLADATTSAGLDRGGRANVTAGYGVSVVPLLHVSVESILPMIENFVTRQGLVKTDKARNALLFQGTAAERRAGMEAVLSFDQEWLSGQSVGLYPVRTTSGLVVRTG